MVDHATLNRWVGRYAGQVAEDALWCKRPTDRSWRMDETYIKVKGHWVYLYRAVDKFGKTLDFMLSERRNNPSAIKFFARALEVNGLPRQIVIDKSGANTAGIIAINRMLKRFGCQIPIEMVRIKYLNNMVEQDHRFIKRRARAGTSSSTPTKCRRRLVSDYINAPCLACPSDHSYTKFLHRSVD